MKLFVGAEGVGEGTVCHCHSAEGDPVFQDAGPQPEYSWALHIGSLFLNGKNIVPVVGCDAVRLCSGQRHFMLSAFKVLSESREAWSHFEVSIILKSLRDVDVAWAGLDLGVK